MSQPLWKKIAAELEQGASARPHLNPIRERVSAVGVESVATELVREMAWALGRAEEKVSTALAVLASIGEEIDALAARGGEASRARARARVADFNKQREAAKQALWELRVHREALGFRLNDDLVDRYPIPPRRS